MGYTTEFRGEITLDKPLTEAQVTYLKALTETRRMKRDPEKAKLLADPVREAVGLPIGEEGEYFVGGRGVCGQSDDPSVIEHNTPAKTQPGLWNHWIPDPYDNGDFDKISWDGGEKFYYYEEWMEYIIENFIKPWGYVANGSIEWRGEDWDDTGILSVDNNVVSV